nr:RNA-dependent RNA polymerase [Saccharomyces cerevisiae partitivirus 1]
METGYQTLFRYVFGSYKNVDLKQGFGTRRVEPSPFIKVPGYEDWWRDVTDRTSMEARFKAFSTPITMHIDEDLFSEAVNDVYYMFFKHYGAPLRVSSIDESISKLPNDTAAGLPFKPGVKKGQVWSELRQLVVRSWREVKSSHRLSVLPCKAGARRQLRERGKNKPRLIFAYPGYLNIIETQFTLPFTVKPPPFLGWSLNWLDKGCSVSRLKRMACKGGSVANLDFSSFDSSVSSHLIRSAFDVVRSMLLMNETESEMLKQLEDYFIHTPLLMYNTVRVKHRGIPSGSGFTQLIGSIVNAISCVYVSKLSSEFRIMQDHCVWLGDDSFLVFDQGLSKDDFIESFLSKFSNLGLNVNADKTEYTKPSIGCSFVFLSRRMTYGKTGMTPDLKKLAGQITWPEFKDKTPADTIQRLIGLAWAFGFNEQAYRLLLNSYVHVVKKNRISRVQPDSRFYRRFQLMDFGDINLSKFPNFNEICNRYYGKDFIS